MTKINQLAAGTIFSFASKSWILLNPQTGLVIAKDAVALRNFNPTYGVNFDPATSTNIGYYLNTTFYNSLTVEQKSMIRSRSQGIAPVYASIVFEGTLAQIQAAENRLTATINVGLLSLSEYKMYVNLLKNKLSLAANKWAWLLTGVPLDNTSTVAMSSVWIMAHADIGLGSSGIDHTTTQVHPTITLDPALSIINGIVTKNTAPIASAIPAQNVRKNTTAAVNLANYFSDAEGNTLTYTASSNNTGIATVAIAGGILTVTGRSVGNVVITVTANDGSLATSQTFAVTVVNTGPIGTTIPNQTTKKNTSVTINLANYFSDVDHDALSYSVSSGNTNVATVSVSGTILTVRGVSIGSALITVTASDSKLTASQSFTTTVTNSVPTVAVTAPAANVTLYENDLFNLAGQAADVDANQSVTVYAQINNDQRIVLAVGLSNAPVTFNKSLKFKGGQLFDSEIAITGNLTDGVAHTLKIWAQDGDGAQSVISQRTFYVVPNRPPLITVDTIVPNGIIDADVMTISGTAGDPDNNQITASYRINNGNSVPIEITAGAWSFDIALAQLTVGQNTIVVEVVDTYNSKVSKTIKLNKNEVKTPILHSVARYKIEPPKGSAKGVLLYLQRDEDLTDLTVELSMVIQGEQENYVPLTADNTAPISEGIVEDEFYFEADEAKNHIILKLSTTRPDVSINHKIHLISGVLE